jgi:hypothetical protein
VPGCPTFQWSAFRGEAALSETPAPVPGREASRAYPPEKFNLDAKFLLLATIEELREVTMSIATHIMFRLVDQRVILQTAEARLGYVEMVTRIGRKYGLLGHGLPDTHGHVVAACTRREAGKYAQSLETGLRLHLPIGVRFDRARIKEIGDQHYLNTAIRYVHRQPEHHGVDNDRFYEASSLPDLLGARVGAGAHIRERVRWLAPRLRLADLEPATLRVLQSPATPTIEMAAVAAAAAVGLPSLRGRGPAIRRARVAALAVASDHAMDRRVAALCCSRTTLWRLLEEPPDPAILGAVRTQLRWRFPEPREEIAMCVA